MEQLIQQNFEELKAKVLKYNPNFNIEKLTKA